MITHIDVVDWVQELPVVVEDILNPPDLSGVYTDVVTLSWEAYPANSEHLPTDYYEVWRSVNNAPFALLASPLGTEYIDNTIIAGNLYEYTVRAVSGEIESLYSNQVDFDIESNPPLGDRVEGKIAYDSNWAYQDDSSLNNYETWVDDSPPQSSQVADHPTSHSVPNLLDPVEVIFTFPEPLDVEITEIRLYDGAGGTIGRPVKFKAVLDDGSVIQDVIPPFHGEGTSNFFNGWHIHTLNPLHKKIKKIIVEKTFGSTWFTKIWFYGSYIPFNVAYPDFPKTKLKTQYGVNAFPWDNSGQYSNASSPDAIEKLSRFNWMSFYRAYDDWNLFENDNKEYAFAPAFGGGWNQDLGFSRLKAQGVKNIQCIKTLTKYLVYRYPQALDINGKQHAQRSQRNWEGAHLRYKGNIVEYEAPFPASGETADLTFTFADGSVNVMFPYTLNEPTYFFRKSDQIVHRWDSGTQTYIPLTENIPGVHFEIYTAENATSSNPIGKLKTYWGELCRQDRQTPASYIDYAQMAFQCAARYGANASIDPNLIHTSDKLVGLDLIWAWEAGNELNAQWHGRARYVSPTEMAALLSAIYDGHMNTMGPGVGVKNADPNLLVANGGIVSANPRFFRAMLDWCREHRGYLPNGDVNVCWDVVKYHQYTNSKGLEQHSGGSDRVGLPADMGITATEKVIQIKQVHYEYCPNKEFPVHIGENGYDEGRTTQSVPIIPGTTVFDENTIGINNTDTGYIRRRTDIRADWFVRDMLEYAWFTCDSQETYLMEDPGGGGGGNFYNNTNLYGSSGLSNRGDYWAAPRAPRPSMWFQRQVVKLFGEYPPTERLSEDPRVQKHEYNGSVMYALWVPDVIGRVEEYVLSLPGITQVTKCTLADDTEDMDQEVINISGSITIQVTETPQFILI